MWADEPGGWAYELAGLARDYAGRGEHYLASLAHGVAKFPVLAGQAKQEARRRQVEDYLKAAPGFVTSPQPVNCFAVFGRNIATSDGNSTLPADSPHRAHGGGRSALRQLRGDTVDAA